MPSPNEVAAFYVAKLKEIERRQRSASDAHIWARGPQPPIGALESTLREAANKRWPNPLAAVPVEKLPHMPARIPITRNGVPTWEETRVPIDTPDLIGPDFSDQILVELVRSGRIERYAYQRRRWGKFTAYRLAVTADPSGPRDSTGAKSKRGRRKAEKQLTEKQTQAVHIVGDCKGNFTEAARRLGCAPKTVRQHYQAAMRKLGKRVTKAATHALPSDRRGQESVSADRRKD